MTVFAHTALDDSTFSHSQIPAYVVPYTLIASYTMSYDAAYTWRKWMDLHGGTVEWNLNAARWMSQQQPFCACGAQRIRLRQPQERDKIYTFNASNDFDDWMRAWMRDYANTRLIDSI